MRGTTAYTCAMRFPPFSKRYSRAPEHRFTRKTVFPTFMARALSCSYDSYNNDGATTLIPHQAPPYPYLRVIFSAVDGEAMVGHASCDGTSPEPVHRKTPVCIKKLQHASDSPNSLPVLLTLVSAKGDGRQQLSTRKIAV